ncbi:uncharacterized protein [Apostichopus japonicus]|uniref:uncharacterized protein n=1 Tax=Stichopus japonicus TaxID=307972 RepID=UPI003AB5CF38
MLSVNQWRAFTARCVFLFFAAGTYKSCGVLVNNTVSDLNTNYIIVAWAFSLQIGTCYLIAPVVHVLLNVTNGRILTLLGGILLALVYVLQGGIRLTSTWQLFGLLISSGIGLGLINMTTVVPLKDYFGKEDYLMAYLMSTFSNNVGVALLPLLLEHLISIFGYQIGKFAYGFVTSGAIIISLIIPSPKPATLNDEFSDTEVKPEEKETLPLIDEDSQLQSSCDDTNKFLEYAQLVYELFKCHPDFFFLLLTAVFNDVQYTTWSMFLVPYGEFFQLPSETAVLLSTFGGVSGIFGRAFAVCLIYFEIHNVIILFGLPSFLVTIAYLISLFFGDFVSLALVSCLSGFGISMHLGLSYSMPPLTVCEHHMNTAVVLTFMAGGIFYQLGAVIAGTIAEVTGSLRYTFAWLAGWGLLEIIIVVIWSCLSFSKSVCNYHIKGKK